MDPSVMVSAVFDAVTAPYLVQPVKSPVVVKLRRSVCGIADRATGRSRAAAERVAANLRTGRWCDDGVFAERAPEHFRGEANAFMVISSVGRDRVTEAYG